ncbi:MAG: hypothetical protein ACW99F_00160 [Candidatus Hodarchaeales archaeon]|jgi:hypothetical protein
MNKNNRINQIQEFTKYFDICYWKERRINPESADLKNWTTRKRRYFHENWYGMKKCQ